jgi:uncharacterized protein
MTTQEEQMLQGLTDRVNNTQLSEKDPEAEQFLQKTLGRNPDALYILSQTLLVQQYALDQAQKQIADTRAQLDQLRQPQPKHATSFLGNLLGRDDAPSAPPPPQPQFTPVPSYPSSTPAFGAPQYAAPQSGGFLRSAAQTAAGVAAGALAFQGIESLMHGFGHSAGYGSDVGSFGGVSHPEEVINNYYGDTSPREHGESSEHQAHDFEDRRDDSRLSDAVYHDDRSDSLTDDSNLTSDDFADDSANFDDSSDFDSGNNDDNSF